MTSKKGTPFRVPVDAGLDLANPPAALQLGKLVRAQNKAPGYWGPRHGTTFIDRVSRGRGNPTLNGSTSYLTGYYNTYQMNLGRKWSVDAPFKIGTLSGATSQFLFCFGDANYGAIEVTIDENGKVNVSLYDDDDNNATLSGVAGHSNGDTVHVRVTRSDGTASLYVNTVLEDSDTTTLTAASDMKVRAQNLLVGKVPSYHAGSYDAFSGTFGGLYIRNFVDTDFAYAFSELPFPKGGDVIAAWTGELIDSDSKVFDASRYRNPLVCSNISSGNRVAEVSEPVHALKNTTTFDGLVRNIVLVGGRVYSKSL